MNNDYVLSQQKESTRHQRTLKRLELKAFIDQHIVDQDEDYQMLKEQSRLPEKQKAIDIQHHSDVGQYLLSEGDRADLGFKPKKQYTNPSILDRIGNFIKGI
jgi:hypothetical protein